MPIKTSPELAAFGGHPKYRENESKAKHNGIPLDSTHCCALCGKKAMGGKTFVALTNMGEYTTKEEMAEHWGDTSGGDDLGLYPVGADCMKKLVKAGVTVYDWDYNVVAAPKGPVETKERA